MSRVGNKPIQLPAGAKVTIKPGMLEVKGPKGELSCPIPGGVEFKIEETGEKQQVASLIDFLNPRISCFGPRPTPSGV
jgi:ribosomal protein L6P/L9E